ncbi:MAG: hypothetical protein WC686_01285 [Candidatus Shapirobacteria bacterium]|jgi:hypothetical protein
MTEQILPPPPVSPQTTPPSASTRPSGLILGLVIGIFLTASAAFAVYFYVQNQKLQLRPPIIVTPTSLPTSATPTPSAEPSLPSEAPLPTSYSGINWLDNPVKIAKLDIFKNTPPAANQYVIFEFSNSTFYHVANLPDGSKMIDITIPLDAPTPNPAIARILQSPAGKVTVLTKHLIGISDNDIYSMWNSPVSYSTTQILELTTPETLKTSLGVLTKAGYSAAIFFDAISNPQKITESDYGTLYVAYAKSNVADAVFSLRSIYLRSKDNIMSVYQLPQSFFTDDKVPNIKWSDGSQNTTIFQVVPSGGCGASGGIPVLKPEALSGKVKSGVIVDGKEVFQLNDSGNAFIKEIYQEYKNTRTENIISIDQFVQKRTHFIFQDALGDWQAYINQDYVMMAECGKPVIYLYPQKDTAVTVKVGAVISQSDPKYPQNGWTVLAKPSGELIYANQSYPYLFWEGMGFGDYPNYQNRGVVVTQKDLITTLYSQLNQLGLNSQESADFMEFWQPRLPSSPYVRLTWLNTADMDRLAPLAVSPKPDTTIRTFLEFEGLDEPVTLIPQTLSAPLRQGFTLVEWGGLLRK